MFKMYFKFYLWSSLVVLLDFCTVTKNSYFFPKIIYLKSKLGLEEVLIVHIYSHRCMRLLSSKNISMITDDVIVDSININSLVKLQLVYFTSQLRFIYLIV